MSPLGNAVASRHVSKHMRWISCAVFLCLGAWMGHAQEADTTAKKQPPPGILKSLTIRGNHLYSADDIAKTTGLHLKQRVTAPVLEAVRQKLLATDLFTNVTDTYRYTGNPLQYDVTMEIEENQQLFPMVFERFPVAPEAIRQYLHEHVPLYADRIPGTDTVLHRYAAAVQAFVAQTDPALKVKAQVSNDDPKQLTVLFTPNTPAPTIAQVLVSGNQAVDTGTILRAVNSVAIGVPLTDARLKMILDGAIKPLYAAKGYPAVSFPKVETEKAKENLGMVVKVQIQDGPQFKFGAIRFHGSGLDEEEIRSNIPFKPGQVFDGSKVDNFRLDLAHRLRRQGLLDASVTTETQADDSKRVVNVAYNVVPGEPYHFQKLDIQGLDVATQPAIEKLWGEKPGKPFNPDYSEFFLKRVQEMGLFDNLADTRSDYTADSSTHGVTVHLYFKGGKSRQQMQREKQEEEERKQDDGGGIPPGPLNLFF
jgi:outer membrane protein assembly factor BamA